jgi:magnesium transporter
MIDCIAYDSEKKEVQRNADWKKLKKFGNVLWIDFENAKEEDILTLKDEFGLHRLSIEDCVTRETVPKLEIFENHIFVVFKGLEFDPKTPHIVDYRHFSAFLGENFLITVHRKPLNEINSLKEKIMAKDEAVLKKNADFLLYMIFDGVVDNYLPVMDHLEDALEELEELALQKPQPHTMKRIFKLKKELIFLRKIIWPERDLLLKIEKGTIKQIRKRTVIYYRDVYDHLYLAQDRIEGYRDTLSTILDIYLSSVSNNMNEVMKALTVVASLVLVPTLIAGIYGMNFQVMPELAWEYGYFFALGAMALTMIFMWVWFRRKGWV